MTEVEALQAGQTNCSGSPLRAVPHSGQTKPVTLFISKILRDCGQRVFLSCFYFFPVEGTKQEAVTEASTFIAEFQRMRRTTGSRTFLAGEAGKGWDAKRLSRSAASSPNNRSRFPRTGKVQERKEMAYPPVESSVSINYSWDSPGPALSRKNSMSLALRLLWNRSSRKLHALREGSPVYAKS